MSRVYQFLRRLSGLGQRTRREAEMAEEMRFHLEMLKEERIAEGSSHQEAELAAQRQFGNVVRLQEQARHMWGWQWLFRVFDDVRYAVRRLVKTPSFSLVAILTLALGIGLNTSMFSLMDEILLRPPPYSDEAHLIRIFRTTPQSQQADHTARDYFSLRQALASTASLAAFEPLGITLAAANVPPVELSALQVSPEFFHVLGVNAELGRLFDEEDDRRKSDTIVLNYHTWRSRFASDPRVIGQVVRVDGKSRTVIGVLPNSFASLFLWGPGEAFCPLGLVDSGQGESRQDAGVRVIGHAKSGVSLAQINARLASLAGDWSREKKSDAGVTGLRAVLLRSIIRGRNNAQISLLLVGLAVFVLLIACANLANLQLARALSRSREFAIRAALGASRGRLLTPILVESLLLSGIGGAAALLVALGSNHWVSRRLSISMDDPNFFQLSLNGKTLAFTLVISVLTGLIFGTVPAWIMSRVNPNETLKNGGRAMSENRQHHHLRQVLIAAQFALALVLLAGADFFVQGSERMLKRELGWTSSHLLQGTISLPEAKYRTPAMRNAFYQRLEEKLSHLPGVISAGMGSDLPMFQYSSYGGYLVEGRDPPQAGHEPLVAVASIGPSYLALLEIHLLSGRKFAEADSASSAPVGIINEALALALFPHESPIGRRIAQAGPLKPTWIEIVGVVPNVHLAVEFQTAPTSFVILRPLAQATPSYVTFALRASQPEALTEPARRTVTALDPDLAVQHLSTVEQFIEYVSASTTMIQLILVVFAFLGLFLAALGLYGAMAHLVAKRTGEIGLRMALGAQPQDILRLVIGSGVPLLLIGGGFGILGAYGMMRFLAGIAPVWSSSDMSPIFWVSLLLFGVAMVASWLPARRAIKIDPICALRAD